jgi:hypothetical protein
MAHRIYSNLILISLIGYTSLLCAEDFRGTVLTDPNIARRCEILTENRAQKIANKQRYLALIERNKHLQKITPENKETLKKKLETNLGHLEHELALTLQQIQFQEENIVRKGCPGISL